MGTPWWLYAVSIGLPIAACVVAIFELGGDPEVLFSDPSTTTNQPFYLGLFSNLGVVFWWTAAVSCALAAGLLGREGGGYARKAMITAALFSGWLALDDLVLLHDGGLRALFGVSEVIVFAVYALVILWYLWRFRAMHLAFDTGLLAAALLLLGLSTAVDLVEHVLDFTEGGLMIRRLGMTVPPAIVDLASGFGVDLAAAIAAPGAERTQVQLHGRFLEETPKFAGIVAWAAYHARAASRLLRAGREPDLAGADPAAERLLRHPA